MPYNDADTVNVSVIAVSLFVIIIAILLGEAAIDMILELL